MELKSSLSLSLVSLLSHSLSLVSLLSHSLFFLSLSLSSSQILQKLEKVKKLGWRGLKGMKNDDDETEQVKLIQWERKREREREREVERWGLKEWVRVKRTPTHRIWWVRPRTLLHIFDSYFSLTSLSLSHSLSLSLTSLPLSLTFFLSTRPLTFDTMKKFHDTFIRWLSRVTFSFLSIFYPSLSLAPLFLLSFHSLLA